MTGALREPRLSASRVEVRPSVVSDIYRLSATLRDADREEVESLGIEATLGIRRSFRDAILRKTYFVDGEVAAMSGLCGSMLGDIASPYLMTGPAVERVPLAVVRHAKESVLDMLRHKRLLEGHVAASYSQACRMLELIGFTLELARPVGPHQTMFRRYFMMRDA